MARLYRTCIILMIVLGMAACIQMDYNEHPTGIKSRTLIVYMGGDNNLSGETHQKIEAIQRYVSLNNQFAEKERFEILIYQDPTSASGESPRLWRAKYGAPKAELISTYDTENSASSATLARVIGDCIRISPAEHYGLWVFSHGSGWLPSGTLTSPYAGTRSIIVDGEEEMEIKEFAQAMPDGVFDFVVFEACFMAGVEVAYELRNKTDYLLASSAEILSPGMTDIYSAVLPEVMNNDLVSAARIYFEHWDKQSTASRAATVSVIRTAALGELAAAVREIKQSSGVLVKVGDVQHFDRNVGYRLFFDLEDCFSRMATSNAQVQRLSSAIDNAVVYQAATPSFLLNSRGFEIKKHCGLTTYMPQSQFPFLNQAYLRMEWCREIN